MKPIGQFCLEVVQDQRFLSAVAASILLVVLKTSGKKLAEKVRAFWTKFSQNSTTLANSKDLLQRLAPRHCYQKCEEHKKLVDHLLKNTQARVIIYGVGGLGKTTLAEAVLSEKKIKRLYRLPEPLNCVGFEFAKVLDQNIHRILDANGLDMEGEPTWKFWPRLNRKRTLILIDGLETLYKNELDKIERIFSVIRDIKDLAVIITIQTVVPPSQIFKTLELNPKFLNIELARKLFLCCAGEAFAHNVDAGKLDEFLSSNDRLPLLLYCLGVRAHDGIDDIDTLSKEYATDRDEFYFNHLQYSLQQVDATDRQMAENIICQLALLPNGMLQSDLDALFPDHLSLLGRLKHYGLIYSDEKHVSPKRYRLLSYVPIIIRTHFTANPATTEEVSRHYVDLLIKWAPMLGTRDSNRARELLVPESINFARMIDEITRCSLPLKSLRELAEAYGRFVRYTGSGSTHALEKAVPNLTGMTDRAHYYRVIADILYWFKPRSVVAWENYRRALRIYEQDGSTVFDIFKAHCLRGLADCMQMLEDFKFDDVINVYDQAIGEYLRCGDAKGLANCDLGKSELYLKHRSFHGAMKHCLDARKRYDELDVHEGLGNSYRLEGQIMLNHSPPDVGTSEGRDSLKKIIANTYEKALKQYAKIDDPYTLGITHRELVFITRGEERQEHARIAVKHFRAINRDDLWGDFS